MQPDIQNVEVPDWIAGGSALLLFIALFLPWTRGKFTGGSVNGGASFGWICIVSVLAVGAIFVLTLFDMELPFPTGLACLGAGGLAVLLTVLVMLVRPISTGGFNLSGVMAITNKIPWYGSWIGLLAGIGIVVGGFMKFREQRY